MRALIRPLAMVATVATMAVASVVGGTQAMADSATVPGAPTITSVSTGGVAGQLLVAYSAPTSTGSSAITSYQATVDGGANWLTCSSGTSGTCPLVNLPVGRQFTIQLRAVNSAGAGAPSVSSTGTAEGPDPDKPGAIAGSKVIVKATFSAAANGLGVNPATAALGVGTLPKLTFSTAILDKAVVEKHLKVTATDVAGGVHAVPGAWGWLDDRTVMFRPADFWPGNSIITITSTMDGAVLGKSSSTLVGSPSLRKSYAFRTGRSFIARVDGKKDRMSIFIDGVKVKSFGVSLGQKDWETTGGVKVISSQKEPKHTYTSASLEITGTADVFDPRYYNLTDVPWNTRLTPTGEFIHAAPWASGRIGKWNGSHGCTNMFEKDAKWIYDNTIPGDVVVYTNTGGQTVSPGNGPGGLWNIPWATWLKKSALGSGGAPDTTDLTVPAPGQGSGPSA